MSSHYIYISCMTCDKRESVYTGDKITDEFDCDDWEGDSIPVRSCIECKKTALTSPGLEMFAGTLDDLAALTIRPAATETRN